jgi:hypothetical protein
MLLYYFNNNNNNNNNNIILFNFKYFTRLAYAMSINKSQGQQYNDILFDTTHPPFTHGHLYVALSRITKYNRIRFFTLQSKMSEDNESTLLENIVFPELLQSILKRT